MPNNVTNVIKFDCEEEKFLEIAESVKRDDGYLGSVDFNKLIPMPEELDISSGSLGMSGYKLYKEYLAEIDGVRSKEKRNAIRNKYLNKSEDAPEALELGKKYYDNLKKYGAPTWYEWCCDNWGTKWNAYDCSHAENNTLYFETAWSGVPAIVKRLSEKYPEVKIDYSWADEDIGRNVGRVIVQAGSIKDITIPEAGSKEAYEMSADIIGFCLDEVGFVLSGDGKTYIYQEREDLYDPPTEE